MIGTIHDITDRIKNELEIRKHRDHLEQMVTERTADLRLSNEQLRQEIIERMQAEEKLRKLHQAVEQSSSAVVITDIRGKIEYVNPRFTQLSGYSIEKANGLNPRILKSGKQSPEFYKNMWDAITSGNEWKGEFCNKKKNGEFYWESASISPVRNPEGEITHFVAVKEDITERKRSEEELRIAKERAEVANQAKSAFLANMSHDIRTPMNSVLGFLEMVLEEPSLSGIQRKHLTTAHISANALLTLINDILDISKLESGRLTIEQHPFSLSRLMHEIQSTLNITAHAKGLVLQLDIHPDVSGIFDGDPLRLRQILMNIVGNAVKFTQKGGVFMRVMPAEEKGYLHFMIEDTGIGIPADRLSKIFNIFIQADASTTRRFGGTGLGTTISKELVELMGGRIWAESEEGKGSIFHFTINLPPSDQILEDTDLFIVPGRIVPAGSRRGFRILLAEDVEANLELAVIRLEQQGHQVTVARNGHEVIEAFISGEMDVILMDIQMPGMSGLEAAQRIRTQEADTVGHTPIIAITAGVMREETEKYLAAGMDAVIAKPIDFGKLFKTMEKVIPEGAGEMIPEDEEAVRSRVELELPLIDGIDIKKGLQTWQEPDAYAKALMKFSRNYADAAADLVRLVDEGDISRATRLIHTLKGVAGNLRATDVAAAANRIDTALRENKIDNIREQLSAFAGKLKTVVNAVRRLESFQNVQEAVNTDIDEEHLKRIFCGMLQAFDQFNPSDVEPFVSELKVYLSNKQLKSIVDHMEQFDFDGAKQESIKLAKTLQIDLTG